MSTVQALERCHRCGGAVEVYAATCAHCGAALTEEKRKIFRQMVADGFVTEEAFEVIEQLLEQGPSPLLEPRPGPRKQITDLTLTDLEAAPVWEFAIDEEGEPGQDEETVRPCPDLGVVDASQGLFVVAARFTAADGTIFSGYVTPSDSGSDAESPTILTASGDAIPFWYGIRKPTREVIDRAYELLDKTSTELFPIRVEALVPTTTGTTTTEVEGFGYFDKRLDRLLTR